MNLSREVLRRLGVKLCHNCGSVRNVYRYSDQLTCYACIKMGEEQKERAHQKKMSELEGQLAVVQSDRGSSSNYREACTKMAKGMGETFNFWWHK